MDNLAGGEWPESTDAESSFRLTLSELEVALKAADPTVFLVLPRILRRVIKQDQQLAGFGLSVPHRKSYVIDGPMLREIVENDELGLPEGAALPETVILLPRPDQQKLEETPAEEILLDYWRLLFHARVHVALEKKLFTGELTAATIDRRIRRIGVPEFDEVRAVLAHEDLLLPADGEESVYVEFAATYLELRYFSAGFLPHYFPGLKSLETVDEILAEDLDADALFEETRPIDAPDPRESVALDELADSPEESDFFFLGDLSADEAPSESKYRLLMRKSQRPAEVGNVVRAAIYHARARRCAPREFAPRAEAAIKDDLHRLIHRLQSALEIESAGPQLWRDALFALVGQTPRGIWTIEARLLYDLQKVCVDHEREVYKVDLIEWVKTLGRRPLKRPLPSQRDVLMLKHLQSAAGRLSAARIPDPLRRQLARLLTDAMRRVEARLRLRLRPRIETALDQSKLRPQNLAERVARKKMVEELLDQIVERGFLNIGALRDAISRNNLKLPDLSEAMDFLRGDQLLQADRRLSLSLDGVYRHGEFYMRWMQRLSSLAFGTRVGRFLTRFVAVPFGGSYVILAGLYHAWHMIPGIEESATDAGFKLTSPSVLLLGCFIMLLVNSAVFRSTVGKFLSAAFRVFHALLLDPIRWLVQTRLLQQIYHSRPFQIAFRFVVKPAVWTAIVWYLFTKDTHDPYMPAGAIVTIFIVFAWLLNSRVGRTTEEVAVDWTVQGWQRFGWRFITGLFWFVVDTFRRFMAVVERLMYSVDEFLRFRTGETRTSLAFKAVFGVLWFFVAYVLRFAVMVLIEPQINPIKHFPVVTVAHKLLLPFYKPLTTLLEAKGMSEFAAWGVSFGTIFGIPGVFGFLVWELKENWRLYGANRRPLLGSIPIGSHGESMSRLLKPGLHSGTLSKRYAKLRRAERHARSGRGLRAAHKHFHAIQHIELNVRRWVAREFIELTTLSKSWTAADIIIDEIRLGSSCVRLTLGTDREDDEPAKLIFEIEAGRLVAGISRPGWIGRLPPDQRRALSAAICGFYKTAGVELVRQQIESEFQPPVAWFEISNAGLLVWPEDDSDTEVLYDLSESDEWIAPQAVRGLARRRLPTIERKRIVFAELPVRWDSWVEAWEGDASRPGNPLDTPAVSAVLPKNL